MPRMEDILNLPVQDPPCAEFSSAQIKWVKVEGGRQGGDDIALIPFARVDDFVKGESSNAECPASFRIESRRKRPEGSISKPRVDGYLEYTLYVAFIILNPVGFVLLFLSSLCAVEGFMDGYDVLLMKTLFMHHEINDCFTCHTFTLECKFSCMC